MTDNSEFPDISDPTVQTVLADPEAFIIDALINKGTDNLTDEDQQAVEFAAKLSVARALVQGGMDDQAVVDKINEASHVSVGTQAGLLFVTVTVAGEDLTKISPVNPEDQEAFNEFCEGLEEAKRALTASPLPTIEDTDEAWAAAQKDPDVAALLSALDALPTTEDEVEG